MGPLLSGPERASLRTEILWVIRTPGDLRQVCADAELPTAKFLKEEPLELQVGAALEYAALQGVATLQRFLRVIRRCAPEAEMHVVDGVLARVVGVRSSPWRGGSEPGAKGLTGPLLSTEMAPPRANPLAPDFPPGRITRRGSARRKSPGFAHTTDTLTIMIAATGLSQVGYLHAAEEALRLARIQISRLDLLPRAGGAGADPLMDELNKVDLVVVIAGTPAEPAGGHKRRWWSEIETDVMKEFDIPLWLYHTSEPGDVVESLSRVAAQVRGVSGETDLQTTMLADVVAGYAARVSRRGEVRIWILVLTLWVLSWLRELWALPRWVHTPILSTGVGLATLTFAYWSESDSAPTPSPLEETIRGANTPKERRRALGMEFITIPGGSFMMGSNYGAVDEQPAHKVILSTFQMGKTEVTVAQYRACVEAGACTEPGNGTYCNYNVDGRDKHPVNCIDHTQATIYARWVGGTLPTEAQWEFAARGSEGRKYPWGYEPPPTCGRVVASRKGKDGPEFGPGCGLGTTEMVCSRPSGNTPQGLCDMAGNLKEWLADWYGASYYATLKDETRDPAGPSGSRYGRVVRGGSWLSDGFGISPSKRDSTFPTWRTHYEGVRVVLPSPVE